jgi:hypothetical protein
LQKTVEISMEKFSKSSPVTGLEWPRGFQEVNLFQPSDAMWRHTPRLQNKQELAPLFVCWVTLAYTDVRRKVSAVC